MDRKEKMKAIIKFLRERYGQDIEEFLKSRQDIFQLLLTTILSQRTRDENTRRAASNLLSRVSKPEEILGLGEKKLQELIKPAGMYKQKAKNIKKLSEILLRDLRGKIPRTREELLKLPGVGNKTADIVLSYGFGLPIIAVDVHVEVCGKRLGLVRKSAKYMETRQALEELTPEKDRYLVNLGFVRFGQEICLTRNPRCHACPLFKMCEYGNKHFSRKTNFQDSST